MICVGSVCRICTCRSCARERPGRNSTGGGQCSRRMFSRTSPLLPKGFPNLRSSACSMRPKARSATGWDWNSSCPLRPSTLVKRPIRRISVPPCQATPRSSLSWSCRERRISSVFWTRHWSSGACSCIRRNGFMWNTTTMVRSVCSVAPAQGRPWWPCIARSVSPRDC